MSNRCKEVFNYKKKEERSIYFYLQKGTSFFLADGK